MILYSLLSYLFWVPIILGVIYLFRRRNKDSVGIKISKEDSVSQWFLLISVLFLGITIFKLNNDFGNQLTSATIIFITAFVGFLISYYYRTAAILMVSLVEIMTWWSLQSLEWIQGKGIKGAVILTSLVFIFLLFYTLGRYHQKLSKYAHFSLIYLFFGIIPITITLFVFSTKTGLGMLAGLTRGVNFYASWQITLSMSLLFLALIGTIIFTSAKKNLESVEVLAVIGLAFLFGLLPFLPEQIVYAQRAFGFGMNYAYGAELSAVGVMWAILFNFIVFFHLLGLILIGTHKKEEWLINIGTLFLFIFIFIKYFDWFFTFLDKSVFFIGAGAILFGVGWVMEKSRRLMITNIHSMS